MKEKEILSKAADALIMQGVKFTVTGKKGWWKFKKEVREEFEIKPLVLGSLIRISKKLLSLDTGSLTQESLQDKFKFLIGNYELMQKHSRTLSEIVAIAVTNEEKEPSKELVHFLLWNLNPKELMTVLGMVLEQMDLTGFTSCIVSVKGLNVLTATNPENQGS